MIASEVFETKTEMMWDGIVEDTRRIPGSIQINSQSKLDRLLWLLD